MTDKKRQIDHKEGGISYMCKCKQIAADAANLMTSKAKGHSCVNVTVNVTHIVKYIAVAGVAIVGIIFGTKCFNEYSKNKEKEEE